MKKKISFHNVLVKTYMMDLDTIKFDDILMLDFLEELYLFSDGLKGTRIFLLDRNLGCGACVGGEWGCVWCVWEWGEGGERKKQLKEEGKRGKLGG